MCVTVKRPHFSDNKCHAMSRYRRCLMTVSPVYTHDYGSTYFCGASLNQQISNDLQLCRESTYQESRTQDSEPRLHGQATAGIVRAQITNPDKPLFRSLRTLTPTLTIGTDPRGRWVKGVRSKR